MGMMLHQDGSRAEWLAGKPALDLIVTMDDATNELYSAFLVEEEGTASTFRACLEVFTSRGLPSSLYTDRGSHYFFTPKAGAVVDKERLTQVGRALARLGIEHIAAYSPEARGRSERMFGTLQDRLIKELAKADITPGLEDTYAEQRPTSGSATSICPTTTPASSSRRSSRRAPSCPSAIRRRSPRSCASSRSGSSAATTP